MNITTVRIKYVDYQITKEIGCGGQGGVYAAVNDKGHSIAVKITDFTQRGKWKNFYEETNAIKDIQPWKHEYLCNVIEIKENSDYGVIAMDKYDCDLYDCIEKNGFSEDLGRTIFQKICIGLKSLHSCNIAHLDIKPENIMMDLKTITPYIGDYGCCYNFTHNKKCSLIGGTEIFHPPEYASSDPYNPLKSDVFSLGVTLHLMLTGYYPYDIEEDVNKRKIFIDDDISPFCRNLLFKMLQTNPKKRISLDEVMNHPWVTNAKKQSKFRKVTHSISKNAKNIFKWSK